MNLEREWKAYPVLHFDLSSAKHLSADGVKEEIGLQLDEYEKVYGANPKETSIGMRLGGLIRRSYEKTGAQAVVLIDEYDAPLLDVLHDDGRLAEMREVLQEFYQRLKSLEGIVKFCFITSIAKFSQLSISSTLNNLTNVTLAPRFSAIRGITEKELTTQLWEDVENLAKTYKESPEAMRQRLKYQYDGYHFSENSHEVYNPFNLLKSFMVQKIGSWWSESGTPTFLIRQMKHFHTDITSFDKIEVPETSFDQPMAFCRTIAFDI